LLEVGVLP